MCVNSLPALYNTLSKWMLTLSSHAFWSSLISCSNDVSSILLLCAAWRCSRIFCSSVISCWSSSCLFLYSNYFIFHLSLSKSRDKAWISVCCSWMISLRSAFVGFVFVSSSWRRTNSVSHSPDGPSSCTIFLLLPWSCDVNVGNEAPSTPGGDNTRFDAANKGLLHL